MSAYKTAIISSDRLITWGLAHYINMVAPDPEIETFDQLYNFNLNSHDDYYVIFLDPVLLTEPAYYSIEKLYKKLPGTKMVAICESDPQNNIYSFFEEIIHFNSSEEVILEKLHAIYLTEINQASKQQSNTLLSDREKEVLRFVALGLTNKEISDELSISTHTVITHRKNITAKLGIKTIAGLTIYSVLNGIITADEMKK
jgi:DNA-binding CsgD family transcriptional regulator